MLNWKAHAKGQRVELRKWRSGEYFLGRDNWSKLQQQAYALPWWSNSSRTCIMCGEPLTGWQWFHGNACDTCRRQECGE